jgi:hypothetical protein
MRQIMQRMSYNLMDEERGQVSYKQEYSGYPGHRRERSLAYRMPAVSSVSKKLLEGILRHCSQATDDRDT